MDSGLKVLDSTTKAARRRESGVVEMMYGHLWFWHGGWWQQIHGRVLVRGVDR